ncbi:MAG: glutamate formimidoyltransferase [bacterium]
MAGNWIECVPNFSEGRRLDVIEEILAPFRSTPGCFLMDQRPDKDHNRLVVSLIGEPQALCRALLDAARVAVERIDLNQHTGAHPRMGAVDVIPFVPLPGTSMETCIQLARDFGRLLHQETGVPIYFYEEAALKPERKPLEAVRKGQFEGLREEISRPERHPDVGPPRIHPTAGATAVGARKFLIALNVNLRSRDLAMAQRIARAVRASSGGLAYVKAMGVDLAEKGMVQVSMNLVDFEKNPVYRAVEMVRSEARRWGVEVAGCEIQGLVPASALLESAAYYLQLHDLEPSKVIEIALLGLLAKEKEKGSEQ